MGLLCVLGTSKTAVSSALLRRDCPVPEQQGIYSSWCDTYVGRIPGELMSVPSELSQYNCRNNQIAMAALEQIRPAIEDARLKYGPNRVGVVMGTSTSGIVNTENAVRLWEVSGRHPAGFHALQGVLAGLGEFVAAFLQVSGPVSTVSTACSSSGIAFLAARRLLDLDQCDVVVVGGVDSLCELTVRGFASLDALASTYCRPLSTKRDGINIGEAGAVFLMSRECRGVHFRGGAASSDAYHISAPHPEGRGAFLAMKNALLNAGIEPSTIDYLNLHGTGTVQNDLMECKAVNRLLGENIPCSTTKTFTGHTLGAAAALELALCWLLLTSGSDWRLPPSLFMDDLDPDLAPVAVTRDNDFSTGKPRVCMSNSFAFGGSNVSLVIGVVDD
ncbi:MAG: beta-ketoacyl-ACP synthase [Halioglobus sp.]|nr:beta-ketoacyl-ACP synthase [Halioglobus sp.]